MRFLAMAAIIWKPGISRLREEKFQVDVKGGRQEGGEAALNVQLTLRGEEVNMWTDPDVTKVRSAVQQLLECLTEAF